MIAVREGNLYIACMKFIRLFPVILAMFAGMIVNSLAGESLVYFGTYTGAKSQGIYVSKFDSKTGKLSAPELAAEITNPTFLAVSHVETFSTR